MNLRPTQYYFFSTLQAPPLQYVPGDVSSRQGCEDLAASVASLTDNKLDTLINNAGAAWGEPLDRVSGRMNWGFDKILDLNLKGVFYLSRACVPFLRRDGVSGYDSDKGTAGPSLNAGPFEDPGRIINIGSVVGLLPQNAPTHAYDVSKAAVHHLTKKLSADWAPLGITVNAIAPGFVPSKMSAQLGTYATFDDIAKNTPLRRLGCEDDMAGASIYFSSKAGAWTTGVVLNVDGGIVGSRLIDLGDEDA